jgi:hypothetical protein
MKTNRIFNLLGVAVVGLFLLSGCAEAKPAGIPNDQVAAITGNALQAINENDFQKFARDFSPQMNKAFSEDQFNQLRNMLQNTSGNYISLGTPSLSNA